MRWGVVNYIPMNTVKAYKVVRRGNRKYYSWSYVPGLSSRWYGDRDMSAYDVRYYTDGRWVTPKKNCNQFLYACPTLDAAKFWLVGNHRTHIVFEVELPAEDLNKKWRDMGRHPMFNTPRTLLCSRMRLIKKIKL